MSIAVGIDLGSTFSVISYVNSDGVAEVIPNSQGDKLHHRFLLSMILIIF